MTATVITLNGVDERNLGALPQIDIGDFEKTLATLIGTESGLIHIIDPAKASLLSTGMKIKDRAQTGCYASATLARSPAIIAADADYNGLPTLDFSALANSSDLKLTGTGHQASVTMIYVGTRTQAGTFFATELRDVGGSNNYRQVFRTGGADTRIFFGNNGSTAGTINQVLATSLPDPNTKAIYTVSYDDTTKESKIFVNTTSAALGTTTHPANSNVDETAKYCFSGVGGATTTLGMKGKCSYGMIANKAWHTANLVMYENVLALLRSRFTIT